MRNNADKRRRLTEWWRPKAGAIFSLLLFYLALWHVSFSEGWRLLLFSFITLTGFGITGYFLNDWADIPYDRKVGKTNLVDRISAFWRPFILIGLLGITLFPWFVYFKTDYFSLGLIALQLFLQFAYPIPPIRLKNYPFAAIITDSLYAFVIPAILAWHTFDLTAELNGNPNQWLHFLFLGVWMFAMGIRHILNHHVVDLENDRKTKTPNIAISIKPLRIRSSVQWVLFPIEVFGAIAFFAALLQNAGYLPLLAIVVVAILGASHLNHSLPFFSVSFSKTRLDSFVSFQLGLLSCVFLFVEDQEYLLVVLLFLLLFSDIPTHPVLEIGGRRLFYRLVRMVKTPFQLASLAFNWSLYYFRKWILNWSEERNWGEHYQQRLKDLERKVRKERGVVAVFNQNFNKYTETFVSGHLKSLPYHIIPFHGWPAPLHVSEMEHLFSDEFYLQQAVYSTGQLFNTDTAQVENAAVAKRLVDDKAQLILAEFGTMGARLVEISKQCGIPMVVIFYGYDAWHQSALEENKEKYQQLFDQAAQVIGVSQDICKQLEKLGCAKEKIVYLPCYVDLQKFGFFQREFNEPIFLSVGRFCQTKAPHLTILAFSEVVKKLPEAKLIMIGADDGNGVLESCITLIKGLGLDKRIELMGSQPPEVVLSEMKKASIFIQHSVTTPEGGDKEGTPVAIMEAMATGLPIVATRHAGIAEMVEHRINGLLVEEFDHAAMANEMIDLFKNKNRMNSLGLAAAKSIRSNQLVAEHIQRLTALIDKHKH